MTIASQTILLVSDDVSLWAAARRELETKDGHRRVAVVSAMDAALHILESVAPTVILLEEAVARTGPKERPGKVSRLDAVVSSLAMRAPVVVIGPPECEGELSALVAEGVADYVPRSANGLALAFQKVNQRLQAAREGDEGAGRSVVPPVRDHDAFSGGDFGEILRHELNNPLTGILGNAEMLLAEMHRKNDGHIPKGGEQRLITIAALAVRMRETVRRLSERWESQQD
jgi:DNA-binding NarL/FixJ family response regulator